MNAADQSTSGRQCAGVAGRLDRRGAPAVRGDADQGGLLAQGAGEDADAEGQSGVPAVRMAPKPEANPTVKIVAATTITQPTSDRPPLSR